MIPYEWIDRRGDPVLEGWGLQANQLRQLKALLIHLEAMDLQAAVGSLIYKTNVRGVYYSKINGEVALRPRSCAGPDLSAEERGTLFASLSREERNRLAATGIEVVTFLERVDKKDNKERPLLKDTKASERLAEIQADRHRRQPVTLHKARVN